MEPRIQYATSSDGVSLACYAYQSGQPLVMLMPYGRSHIQLELRGIEDPVRLFELNWM